MPRELILTVVIGSGSVLVLVGGLVIAHLTGRLPGQLFWEPPITQVPDRARVRSHRRQVDWAAHRAQAHHCFEACMAVLVVLLTQFSATPEPRRADS